MSLLTMLRPAQRPVAVTEDDDHDACIFCYCRPNVSYCGRFDDGPWLPDEDDGPECADCHQVWATTGCTNCGCVRDNTCARCEVPS